MKDKMKRIIAAIKVSKLSNEEVAANYQNACKIEKQPKLEHKELVYDPELDPFWGPAK